MLLSQILILKQFSILGLALLSFSATVSYHSLTSLLTYLMGYRDMFLPQTVSAVGLLTGPLWGIATSLLLWSRPAAFVTLSATAWQREVERQEEFLISHMQ